MWCGVVSCRVVYARGPQRHEKTVTCSSSKSIGPVLEHSRDRGPGQTANQEGVEQHLEGHRGTSGPRRRASEWQRAWCIQPTRTRRDTSLPHLVRRTHGPRPQNECDECVASCAEPSAPSESAKATELRQERRTPAHTSFQTRLVKKWAPRACVLTSREANLFAVRERPHGTWAPAPQRAELLLPQQS